MRTFREFDVMGDRRGLRWSLMAVPFLPALVSGGAELITTTSSVMSTMGGPVAAALGAALVFKSPQKFAAAFLGEKEVAGSAFMAAGLTSLSGIMSTITLRSHMDLGAGANLAVVGAGLTIGITSYFAVKRGQTVRADDRLLDADGNLFVVDHGEKIPVREAEVAQDMGPQMSADAPTLTDDLKDLLSRRSATVRKPKAFITDDVVDAVIIEDIPTPAEPPSQKNERAWAPEL